MHIEFLLEELSAEPVIKHVVPKIIGKRHSFDVHCYQGKQDLLAKLPARLNGYRRWVPMDWRIVVLIDEDREDCREQKHKLERAATDAGFATKSAVGGSRDFEVMNRLAVEELEAWFFGDVEAIVSAYPKVTPTLGDKAGYRDPDAISGGTWEALERILKRAGYYAAGLPKAETARNVSEYMDPWRNRSGSFQVFRDGLLELVGE